MQVYLEKVESHDLPIIWSIIQKAINRRKEEGSNQWQDGYPNIKTLEDDYDKGVGYKLTNGISIIGYCAILINDEPEYAKIKGKWITNEDFVVFHRLAIAEEYLRQGFAEKLFLFIEEFAKKEGVKSIKADTNYDNLPMLHLFEKLGYVYCGKVYFRGSERKAYEKVLD